MTGRERILNTINKAPVDQLAFMPITMMFAAHHAGISYLDYATNYQCLVEGQLRAAEKFNIDYVNTMSDPAGEAADCGAAVKFYPDQPPALDESNALLADKSRLLTLAVPKPSQGKRMSNRLEALHLYEKRVGREKLIEGWIEGPCAQAADLRGINVLMLDFYDDPAFVRDLFDFVLELEVGFAAAQLDAGAEMIGIGDAAASLVGPEIYDEFIFPYEKRMVDEIHSRGGKVRLHICGNTRSILKSIARLGCDVVDLDSLAPVGEARAKLGGDTVILGNIDPVRQLRDATADQVLDSIADCHQAAGVKYIVSAGCEVPRDTPPENVLALASYARQHGSAVVS
jgi:MtaA/CmuA family methyltransferase